MSGHARAAVQAARPAHGLGGRHQAAYAPGGQMVRIRQSSEAAGQCPTQGLTQHSKSPLLSAQSLTVGSPVPMEFPQSRAAAGLARVDVTPPIGIYHRMWGAATHERASGVHQPLTATVLVFSQLGQSPNKDTVAWVALDHCLLWDKEMELVMDTVSSSTGLPRTHIRLMFSHTHAAGLMGLERVDKPGGELSPQYLEDMAQRISSAVQPFPVAATLPLFLDLRLGAAWNAGPSQVSKAKATMQPTTMVYGTGSCTLAGNRPLDTLRDLYDGARGEYVCGYNPQGLADDTVVVVSITADKDGARLATVVNYACHPTTLAWDNTLISPDYVGSMRQVVETSTGVPCVFIQGASGDTGPRDGYTGDVKLAERNGRQGDFMICKCFRVSACLVTLFPDFHYTGVALMNPAAFAPPWFWQRHSTRQEGAVVSGATIGTWGWKEQSSAQAAASEMFAWSRTQVLMEFRSDLPDLKEIAAQEIHWNKELENAKQKGDDIASRDAGAQLERLLRGKTRIVHLDTSGPLQYPVYMLRMGSVVSDALGREQYTILQREYLPDKDSYGKDLYQEKASVLARGALEKLTDHLVEQISELLTCQNAAKSAI
eukprot:gene11640-2116_t